MIRLIVLFIFFGVTCFGQVGIGTAIPDPSSILEIDATDKGVLIPRVSLTDVTETLLDGTNTAANGLLIYNTNSGVTGGAGVGFYYFNGTTWEKLVTSSALTGDTDWFEVGGTTAPDAITDDQFTQGHVGIGTNTAPYRLQLTETDDTATRTLSINSTNATGGTSASLYNETAYNGSGNLRMLYNLSNGSGGSVTGLFNDIQNLGFGTHTGIENNFSGEGGQAYGVDNDFSALEGSVKYGMFNNFASTNFNNSSDYGLYNRMAGDSDGFMYGVYNFIDNSGVGEHYGVYNQLWNGVGNIYGLRSEIQVSNSGGAQFGVYSYLAGSNNTEFIGNYNWFQGASSTIKGILNDIDNVTAGNIRGVENIFSGDGFEAYGIQNDFSALEGSTKYGLFNTFTSSNFNMSTDHGVYNRMGGASDGVMYGVNNFIDNSGVGEHYGVYNQFSNGVGSIYGLRSEIAVGNNSGVTQYGVHSSFSGTNATQFIGSENLFGGTASTGKGQVNDFSGLEAFTEIRGVENLFTYSGLPQTPNIYGLFNDFNNTSNGDQYGIYQTFSNGGGTLYGAYTIITATTGGDKYGYFTEIDNTGGGGTHYGIYADTRGTGNYSGYFVGNFAVDVSTLFVDSANARVGIGTDTPAYALDVDGDINTSGAFRVAGVPIPDYVFEVYFNGFSDFDTSYRFMGLPKLEAYLRTNKHLPGVQSRAEVQVNGWNLSEAVRDNLEKIEELYLHAIEGHKEDASIEKRMKALEKENRELKQRLFRLESLMQKGNN